MSINTYNNKEIINLDIVDKKLFFYLSQDMRWPRKQLAKKLNISSERLSYRIDRLCKELIEPILLINFPLLGINSYAIFISEQLDIDTISNVIKSREIYHFTQCIGTYRHVIHIVSEDITFFISSYLSEAIISYVVPIYGYYPDNFNGFGIDDKPLLTNTDKPIILNEYHRSVLISLIDSPTASMLEISQKTGIDRRVVKKYFDELTSTNAIQKFRYILNSYKTGFSTYFLLIYYPLSIKTKLINYLRTNKFAGFIYESYGFLYMWYLPPSHEELFSFITEIETHFKKVSIKTLQPTNIYQLTFVPKILKEILG